MNMIQPTDETMQSNPEAIQSANGMQQEITPEKRQELQAMVKKLKDQIEYFNATKVASSGKLEVERKKALKQLFDKMTVAGVDLNNRESVAAFIAKIQQNSPEMAKLFEQTIDSLMGPEGMPQEGMEESDPQNNMNNMNNYENLPETL